MATAANLYLREEDHPATRRHDASLKQRMIESIAEGRSDRAESLREELRQVSLWREARQAEYGRKPASYAVWIEDGKIIERTELEAAG